MVLNDNRNQLVVNLGQIKNRDEAGFLLLTTKNHTSFVSAYVAILPSQGRPSVIHILRAVKSMTMP